MAEMIMVIGPSGSGKTSSAIPNEMLEIKGLDPKNTLMVSFTGKALPKKHYLTLADTKEEKYKDRTPNRIVVPAGDCSLNGKPVAKSVWIIAAMQSYISKGTFKNVVLDDFQYLSVMHLLDQSHNKGYDKFVDNGKMVYDILKYLSDLPSDILAFVLAHDETEKENYVEKRSMKLGGKMVKNSLGNPEGLCNTVLYTESETEKLEESVQVKKYFITQSDGTTTAKSLPGMFPYRIPNDLGLVEKAFREYMD